MIAELVIPALSYTKCPSSPQKALTFCKDSLRPFYLLLRFFKCSRDLASIQAECVCLEMNNQKFSEKAAAILVLRRLVATLHTFLLLLYTCLYSVYYVYKFTEAETKTG
jgi:hypothetical protein